MASPTWLSRFASHAASILHRNVKIIIEKPMMRTFNVDGVITALSLLPLH